MGTQDLIRQYFQGKSEATLAAYTNDIDAFKEYMRKSTIKQAINVFLLLPESQANLLVLHYKSEMLNQEINSSTINRRLSTLRSLVNAARKSGEINWHLDIQNERVDSSSLPPLNQEEIKRLFLSCKDQSNRPKAARDFAIISLLYDLALKRNTIACLQREDFDQENKTLTSLDQYHRTFTKRLPIRTFNALQNWMKYRGNDCGPLFQSIDTANRDKSGITPTSIYRSVKQLGDSLGINVTPELLRKTAIAHVLEHIDEHGFSEKDVLAFSNHKSTQSIKNIRKASEKTQKSLSDLISKN